MSITHETQEKIKQFAKVQSQNYLEDAEMTYLEKLRRKTTQTKNKAETKFARFKSHSEQSREAQNDMALYMSDYINDLISRGLSEQEAFEQAATEMKFDSDSAQSTDLQEKFAYYYENRDPATYEAIGLVYAGFVILGFVIGALIGFFGSGGTALFLTGGWITTIIGAVAGIFIGIGLALVSNAIIAVATRK